MTTLSMADGPLVLLGFVLLMLGGELVVQGAITVAGRLRVPPLLVGFTIVAIGTSLPELAVVLEAVNEGTHEIAVGGVLGSNVANVMLVLGTASLLGAASDPGQGVRRDAVAVAAATAILLAAVLIGGIAWQFGILMLLGLAAYYSYSYRASKAEGTDIEDSDTWLPDYILLAIPVTAVGGYMIWTGAEMLVEGATGLAGDYGISESVIGLSVVALGTSLPELAVTIVAGLRGQGGVAVGNVLGSNVINIMGILGVAATYSGGLIIAPEFAARDIWVVVLTSGFIVAMLLDERHIGKRVGAAMVGGYLAYMAMLYL
ncbi:MAG TPA: calcium/sodium antiporter [Candidatus Poseidoniales archaeon]|jgi:cation:H+ antiporter|nr:MAG: sodium:calcium antiporter [Euryarchaeota archaeon]HIG38569.1 calcium/sodium antiporter [Candidatus Poseidoniales archaeon]HIL44297.1 calcium/sodium antiporter [Candidatus Poseidoniales archaeon]